MKSKYELLSFILRSKKRQEILRNLSEGNKTATDIVKITRMYKFHVSRALKELKEEKLIDCLNPQDREYKFYKLTSKGKMILKQLEKLL